MGKEEEVPGIKELDSDPLNLGPVEKIFDHVVESYAVANSKNKLDNSMRSSFFSFIRWLSAACIGGNFGVFVAYLVSQWNHVSDTVIVAWISATVVEVVAIVAIVARYLFQSDKQKDISAQVPHKQAD
jgi:hypothetical protein